MDKRPGLTEAIGEGLAYPTLVRTDIRKSVADHLQQLILSNELKPSDRLPTEHELVDRFGVSRASVREALRFLEARGLIRVEHGKGAVVCDFGAASEDSRVFLSNWLRQRGITVDEVLEFRKLTEPHAAALAAEHATREQLQAMADAQARMHASADMGDLHGVIVADIDFHRAIVAATQNRLLAMSVDAVGRLLIDFRRVSLARPDGFSTTLLRHDKILRAIVARDPKAAHDYMIEHLGATLENVRAELDTVGQPPQSNS